MVAADEASATEVHPPSGRERRCLGGLPVGDDVGPQVLPVPVVAPNHRASWSATRRSTPGSRASGPGTAAATRLRPVGGVGGAHVAEDGHVAGRSPRGRRRGRARCPPGAAPASANQQHAAAREPGSGTAAPSRRWASGPSVATTTARGRRVGPSASTTDVPSSRSTRASSWTVPAGRPSASWAVTAPMPAAGTAVGPPPACAGSRRTGGSTPRGRDRVGCRRRGGARTGRPSRG